MYLPAKETVKAKTAAIKATAVSKEPLTLPLPELTGPPGPRQPTIEYKGNAGVRQPSHARGKRLTQGQTLRTSPWSITTWEGYTVHTT